MTSAKQVQVSMVQIVVGLLHTDRGIRDLGLPLDATEHGQRGRDGRPRGADESIPDVHVVEVLSHAHLLGARSRLPRVMWLVDARGTMARPRAEECAPGPSV